MTKWDFLTAELTSLEREGLVGQTRTVESAQGAWITVDGKRVLNLCANNYLGLANHTCLREAAHAAIERFGVGPAAVRSIVGTLSLHHELEQKLAAFKGVEATLTLQSGFIGQEPLRGPHVHPAGPTAARPGRVFEIQPAAPGDRGQEASRGRRLDR